MTVILSSCLTGTVRERNFTVTAVFGVFSTGTCINPTYLIVLLETHPATIAKNPTKLAKIPTAWKRYIGE